MNNYAIVVGINHYVPPARLGLRPLNGAIADAVSVANWLVANGGVDQNNLQLLTSVDSLGSVLKHEVDTAIGIVIRDILQNKKGEADRLYFYFAGHGMGVENDSENNGLCLSNWDEIMFNSATISSTDYRRKFVTEGFFKEIVIWLDCCRNTHLRLVPGAGSGVNLQGPNRRPKYFVAIGATYESQAFEAAFMINGTSELRGIFTKVLLDGLNGQARGSNGRVDAESLSGYLYKNVPLEAINAGFSQDPEVLHNTNEVNPLIFDDNARKT